MPQSPQMNLQAIQQFFHYEPTFDPDPQFLIDQIKNQAAQYLNEEKIDAIQKAYNFAKKAHAGQERLSGEPYIIHPVKATEFLMHMKPGLATIQTCLLHDVIEDTPITHQEIEEAFGEEVAHLCDGLVKVSKVRYKGEDRQLETLKKTFLAMARDLRVIFVKIADRVHNIQTLSYHPSNEKKQRIAEETMKIYVPIAKRLGLYHYQLYLENGCFYVIDNKECMRIVNFMEKHFGSDRKYIERGTKKLEKMLAEYDMEYIKVKGRVKSPYRIYYKMQKKYHDNDLSKVLDMIAFRVITKNVGDCYNVLGIIHNHHTPLINKIKDYISLPKANDYRSLHTTIVGMFNFPVEIQIRTQEMDEIAEYGVAAHFEYSERGSTAVSKSQTKWIKKLQEIVSAYQTIDDKDRFKDELNIEVLNKGKFLYTPKGDIIEMPHGSTVLDFAFRIHSDVGLKFKNAIVNGVIKPIGFVPRTGDIIAINTFRNKIVATHYWLDFLHTPSAKSKLQRYLKKKHRDRLINESIGKLNKRLKERKLPLLNTQEDKIQDHYEQEEFEKKLLLMLDKQESYTNFFKEVYPQRWKKLVKPKRKTVMPKNPIRQTGVIVDGDKTIPYNLCNTCKPRIGTKIIARSGRDGIKIHDVHCRGIKTVSAKRLLEAHRANQQPTNYKVMIELKMKNTHANLVNVIGIFSDLHITMDNMSIRNDEFGNGYVLIESDYANPAKIHYLLNALKKYKQFVRMTKTQIS